MEFRKLTERYDLEKILRSGRTSTVMRATDRQSGRKVAVKMIQAVLLVPPDAFPEAASRFHAYAAALEALHHPCLPETLDAGITPDGSAFLVTELVEGRGLDTLAGKLPPSEALALLAPMLDALEALASRGMAHGNLSPDNVLLLEDGKIKLLGLGSTVFQTGRTGPSRLRRSRRGSWLPSWRGEESRACPRTSTPLDGPSAICWERRLDRGIPLRCSYPSR